MALAADTARTAAPDKPRFGFVVLHYLAYDTTVKCVEHLLALETGAPARIVVVDNASPDGSGQRLAQRFEDDERVHVVLSEQNLGFARGNNLGCAALCETGLPDFAVVLNNDVMVDDADFCRKVAASHRNRPFDVLGPDVFCPATGKHQSPEGHDVPTLAALRAERDRHAAIVADFDAWWDERSSAPEPSVDTRPLWRRVASRVKRAIKGSAAAPKRTIPLHERQVDHLVLHGACYVFARSFLEQRRDAFNPATFMFYEEEILAYECRRDGLLMRYDGSIRVEHLEDASTNEAFSDKKEARRFKERELISSIEVLIDEMEADIARFAKASEVEPAPGTTLVKLGQGFAGNALNGAAFRSSACASHAADDGLVIRAACWADADGEVLVALDDGSGWVTRPCGARLDIRDAHNSPSLCFDARGMLHVTWSEHNGALTCLRLDDPAAPSFLGETPDLPQNCKATYPQLLKGPDGALFMLVRTGRSGSGDELLFSWSGDDGVWKCLHAPLISGAGACSPYCSARLDASGRLHIAWCWRDSNDVDTNHDLCHIVSTDKTCARFCDMSGNPVALPVTPGNAPVAVPVPAHNGLLNQGSIAVDEAGFPHVMVTSRVGEAMRHRVASWDGSCWRVRTAEVPVSDTPLAGQGTLRLPFARPALLARGAHGDLSLLVVTRDDLQNGRAHLWRLAVVDDTLTVEDDRDITSTDLGSWEPSLDEAAWRDRRELAMLVQRELSFPDNRNPLEAVSSVSLATVDARY